MRAASLGSGRAKVAELVRRSCEVLGRDRVAVPQTRVASTRSSPRSPTNPTACTSTACGCGRLRSVLGGFTGGRSDARRRGARARRVSRSGRELGVVRDIEVRAEVAREMLAQAGIDDPAVERRLIGQRARGVCGGSSSGCWSLQAPRAPRSARGCCAPFADAPRRCRRLIARLRSVLIAAVARQARRVETAGARLDGTDARVPRAPRGRRDGMRLRGGGCQRCRSRAALRRA